MPRLPRQIEMDADGLYHLRGQVAGPAGYYPFQVSEDADQLLATIRSKLILGLYFPFGL